MQILYFILVLLIILLILYLYLHGAFMRIELEDTTIGPLKFIYKNYQGKYQNIGYQMQSLYDLRVKFFKISYSAAIYYDPPQFTKDQNKCRAVVGIIVNKGESDNIETFCSYNPQFKYAELPIVDAKVSNQFPLTSRFSILFMLLKIYPILTKSMEQDHLNEDKCGIMELYPFGFVQALYVYGPKSLQYYLSSLPQPEYSPNLKLYQQR